MATDPYLKMLNSINKDSNKTQLQIQKLVNSANTLQMKYNTSEAKKARDWQEKMSKNSHQYEVADLKKAGLNPVLSANQGASSYTTSQAAADPESGANAAASLKGSQISAVTNLESSRMSSKATMDAAKMSAEAMQNAAYTSALAQKYASDQSAAATRYASDNSLRASKYKADLDYKASRYNTDTNATLTREGYANQRYLMKNQNANSWVAFLDKQLRNFGVYDKFDKNNVDMSFGKSMVNSFKQRAAAYLKNGKNTKANNIKFKPFGIFTVDSQLQPLGIKTTNTNRKLYVRAVAFGDKKAFKTLMNQSYLKDKYHKNGYW